jgi:putative nucleotidyltransferase with HDIG domain
MGQELGIDDQELSDVFYVALLGSVGCTLEVATFSSYFKDEIAFGESLVDLDPTRPLQVAAYFLGKAGEGDRLWSRARKVASLAIQGPAQSAIVCRDVAMQVGDMLRMGPAVREAVGQCHEQWNGKGWPRRLRGEEIGRAARLYILAHDVEVASRRYGVEAAMAVAQRRSGTQYDPGLATVFCEMAGSLLRRLETGSTWDAFIEAEPRPHRLVSEEGLDNFSETIANFVDVRSSYTLLHSPSVASLAKATARELGLPESEQALVGRAGLLHDIGRAGVPVTTWEKATPLDELERDRMRRHPSLTELVLVHSDALGHLGTLAGLHHERLDGSGYRGVPAASQPLTARILAAADAYQTRLEDRPHRHALTAEAAAEELELQAEAGKLDRDVTRSLLAATGHSGHGTKAQKERPAGLSEREVEVLQLAVRGLSNRQIGEVLYLSPKTVGHHIQHIYNKIDVSTRVGATLFALGHGLVKDQDESS